MTDSDFDPLEQDRDVWKHLAQLRGLRIKELERRLDAARELIAIIDRALSKAQCAAGDMGGTFRKMHDAWCPPDLGITKAELWSARRWLSEEGEK